MAYQLTDFYSIRAIDNIDLGEYGEYTQNHFTYTMREETQEKLISALIDHFEVERDAIVVNACDESGRVDIQRLETYDGEIPSKSEMDDFREGKRDLYSATYTSYLNEINPCSWEA